ncbi:hypothetical protein D9758_009919 [Tetrapyrgos nigripes]|uniref:Uncharacterized protein n=1 Tax=Tetrapyrgos nigripes TaxID=182062 RepID=A0A8H5CS94_9AGAR|nr:hypothetical protein D9758_009919 [Tetrapyrgos nigripes]
MAVYIGGMIHKNYLSSGPYGKPLHATTMSDKLIAKVIVENASRHTKLLNAIAEVENSPRQLAEICSTISELQEQVEECEARVEKLHEKTTEERARADNNEKFGSSFKFWKGKSKSSDSAQKRSIADALQEEMRERDKLAGLQRALSSAQSQKTPIAARAKEYEDLDAQLDALYGLVFSGPTPGYPEEDALEQQVAAARLVHHRAQTDLDGESQTLELLVKAERTMREAQSKLKDGIYWATALAMLAGGRSAEVKESSALRSAHALARKAELEYNEGRQRSSNVKLLDRSKLAKELPQRKEVDPNFHEELKKISIELTETQNLLTTERKACAARTTHANMVVTQAEQTMNDYRKELNTVRRAIFEDIVTKVNNGEFRINDDEDPEADGLEDAPPSYDSPNPQPSSVDLAKYVQYMALGGGDLSNLTGGQFQRNMGSIGAMSSYSDGGVNNYSADSYLHHDPYADEPMSPLSPATSIMSGSTSMSRDAFWRGSMTTPSTPSSSTGGRRPLPRPPQDR